MNRDDAGELAMGSSDQHCEMRGDGLAWYEFQLARRGRQVVMCGWIGEVG